ncbi:MAG: hypothetical protein QOC81_3221 [Thermoanaerobaculia bacterium]|nr:hypothetical protein [Thermoanaerobaculia bacterium]
MKRTLVLAALLIACISVPLPCRAGNNEWTSIGPQLPPYHQIESVTIDPSNPDNLWVLSAGLWRSRDGGFSWDLIADSTLDSALRIVQVTVDPHDSRHILVLAFAGFCQSFDGGDTWVLHHIGTTTLFDRINQFEVASNAATIYAAAAQTCSVHGDLVYPPGCSGGGFWKSANGGITWTLISLKNQTVGQIAVDPFNADTVYAIVYQASVTKIGAGTLMRSRDGGRNWIALSPRACADASYNCSSTAVYLVVEKSNSSTLYFAGSDGLLVSHDGGETWTITTKDFPLPVPDPFQSGLLYVSLGNEPVLQPPPGVPLPPPVIRQYGVVRSSDYGQTWTPVISTSSGHLLVDSRRSFYGVTSTGLFRYTLVVPRKRAAKR